MANDPTSPREPGAEAKAAVSAWENAHWRRLLLLSPEERKTLALALEEFREQGDNPEYDGTDAAHPAWWRGQERGVEGAAERILVAASGKDGGSGVLGSPKLEAARRAVLALRRG